MADSITTFLEAVKPEVGASADTWGGKLNNDLDLFDSAIETIISAYNYAPASGADTITLTLDPAPASLITGLGVRFKAAGDNTAAPTLNVNSLGAKSIKNPDGTALVAGDLKSGRIYTVDYDGTNFVLQGLGIATPSEAKGVTSTKALTALALAATSGEFAIAGFYIKWGSASVTSNIAGTTGDATVTFTTAFPNSCDVVVITPTLASGSGTGLIYAPRITSKSTTTTSFGLTRAGGGTDGPFPTLWIAIGS